MRSISEMNRRRKALGMTYEILSEKSGVPVPTLQKIFSGKTTSPRYSTWKKIEEALFGRETEILHDPDRAGDPLLVRDPAAVYRSPRSFPETAAGSKPQGLYTVADYEQLPDDERWELIDGVLFRMDAPSTEHQNLVIFITHQLYTFAEEGDCDCLVLCAPYDVQLDRDERTMVEPDVLVLCDPGKFDRKRGWGAPDLCVEVLSPSSRSKDQLLKRYKYERAGVREFWVVDPEYERVYVFLFGAEFGEREGMHVYTFEDRVPVSICGEGHEIDLSKRLPAFLRRREQKS